jgi:hypothetical protein
LIQMINKGQEPGIMDRKLATGNQRAKINKATEVPTTVS